MAERGGQIAQRGVSLPNRRALFYGVCIWVRLALAIGVGFAAHRWPVVVPSIVLAVALGGIVVNVVQAVRQGVDAVWWSRPSHAVISFAIAVAAVLVLTKHIPPATLGIFVALDVIFGIISSFMVCGFVRKC